MRHYLSESQRWDTAVLLVVPLLVLYEVGLLLFGGDVRNAADVLLMDRLLHLHAQRVRLIVNAAVLCFFLAAAMARRRRPQVPGLLMLMMVESACWALLLAPITLLLHDAASLGGGVGSEVGRELTQDVGAGLYEELLFRLVLVAGGHVALRRALHVDPLWATVTPLIVSSLLFSLLHHVGSLGEPFEPSVFTFRFLAGVVLGLLFVFRGLAITCWTHALYDVLVTLT